MSRQANKFPYFQGKMHNWTAQPHIPAFADPLFPSPLKADRQALAM
jgi:hypothetical protein